MYPSALTLSCHAPSKLALDHLGHPGPDRSRSAPGSAPRPSPAPPARCRTAAPEPGPRPPARWTPTRPPPTREEAVDRASSRSTTAHVDQHLRAACASHAPLRSGRSPSARSISSAAAMPSPEGVRRMSTMWPDCSPPSTHPRSEELLHDVPVAHVRRRDLDAGVAHRGVESEVGHHRHGDAVAGQLAAAFQVERHLGDDLVAVDDACRRSATASIRSPSPSNAKPSVVPALAHAPRRSRPCASTHSPR